MRFRNFLSAATVAFFLASPAASAAGSDYGYKSHSKAGSFDSVLFELKNAIVDRGLTIDYDGHLGKMLERTSSAVDSVTEAGVKSPYLSARFLTFCSAKITHEIISANPRNIAVCPYVVFAYELRQKPGEIYVGYRKPISDRSKVSTKAIAKAEKLLDDIITDAIK